ncbi:MAG TPA: helix-turn-helix domain-containing protein [Flavobacterium sp.]
MMDKLTIINKIIKHYDFKSDVAFARHIGVSAQVVSNWKSRNTYDAELIYSHFSDLNPEWILTGKGNMLKEITDETEIGIWEDVFNYKDLYEEAKYTIKLQKKYIKNLELQLNKNDNNL